MYDITFYTDDDGFVESFDNIKTYEEAERQGVEFLNARAIDDGAYVIIKKEVARLTSVDEYETETL